MKKIIGIIIIFLSILIFLIGILNSNSNLMLIAVLFLFFDMVVYAYNQKEKGIILFAYLIAFFTFLLGKYTLYLFTGKDWQKDFTAEINAHIQICLYISLLGIYIGFYVLNKSKQINIENKIEYDIEKDENIESIRKISKILFYATICFKIIVILNKIIFVYNNSYLAVYTEYEANLPLIVIKLSEINTFLMYIYLATLPSKRELKVPLFIFLITEIATILSGGRTKAVTVIIFIIAYFVYREMKNRKDNDIKYEWMKKHYVKLIILLIPFVVSFLSVYNLIRSNIKVDNFSIKKEFIQFFDDQGESVKLIGYVKKYKTQLPKTNKTYLFGPIISYFKNGVIGKKIFKIVQYKGNTVESALYGNNLGATLSYIVIKDLYLTGVGLGTQYIAEIYADLGYIGVFVFNTILGCIIFKINFRSNIKWYWGAILISIIRLVIYIPRDFALSWIISGFSITNWGTIIIVSILSKYIKNKN